MTQDKQVALAINDKLEEVAVEIDGMKALGDTAASFAAFVRSKKTKCENLGVCQDLLFPCKDCPSRKL